MTLPPDFQITTEILWQGTLLFAVVDILFAAILLWRLKSAVFRQIRWELIAITAIFWCLLWVWAISNFWETVYQHMFPSWSCWLIPLFQACLTAGIAALAFHFSYRSRMPLLTYLLFGGLWGMVTHTWAVYRGIVDRPPMLHGASPLAAVVFPFFEFILYWCTIITFAALIHCIRKSKSFRRS